MARCAACALVALGLGPGVARAADGGTGSATAIPAKRLDLRGGKRPPRKARVHELDTLDRRTLERVKKDLRSRRRARGLQAPTILAAPTTNILKSASGLAATDNIAANDGTPPDTTGSIGPDNYVEFVNSKVAVYNRNLAQDSTKDLDKFVGVDVADGHDVFDPQIQWDPVAQHWFYVAVDVFDIFQSDEQDFLAFGWSKTDDPSDLDNGWCRFFVSSDTGGASKGTFSDDYPHLGHDDKHVIFGTNVFKISNGGFRTARIWAFNKPSDYSNCGQSVKLKFKGSPQSGALKTKDGNQAFSPIAADLTDSSKKGYVLAADFPGSGSAKEIAVWSVSGSSKISIQSRGNIQVDAYSLPDNVPQPSGGDDLDALDARLTQAVGHADPDADDDEAVWTQHTVNGGPSEAGWYELRPGQCTGTTKCPAAALVQQGTVSDAPEYVFNAAISPTMNGNQAVIHYNVGSSSTEAEIRARSRLSGTPLGEMGDEVTLVSNNNIDQDFSCTLSGGGPPCRWGDYSGASPDPQNNDVVWGSNQLNGNPHNDDPRWITQNFALQPS
jgi:hypothetical protein